MILAGIRGIKVHQGKRGVADFTYYNKIYLPCGLAIYINIFKDSRVFNSNEDTTFLFHTNSLTI